MVRQERSERDCDWW